MATTPAVTNAPNGISGAVIQRGLGRGERSRWAARLLLFFALLLLAV